MVYKLFISKPTGIFFLLLFQFMKLLEGAVLKHWVIPENIHTLPRAAPSSRPPLP